VKNLKIVYTTDQGEQILFDSEIAELVWSDSPNGVKVEGRVKPGKTGGGAGGGLLDMITSMSKAKTEAKIQEVTQRDVETELVDHE
jgi:hypothetical protein